MRWGARETQFVRPVHWVVMLHGRDVIECEILGVASGRLTRGHRFHSPRPISLASPASYLGRLERQGRVIADIREIIKDLRENPRFVMKTPEELIRGYRELAKRVDAELPHLFRTLPRNTYGVRELPKFMQSTAPNGYYYPGTLAAGVPGYFVVNTYRLDQRPTYEMTALFLHEAVPGHHLQFALTAEDTTLAPYRRWDGTLSAHTEGWALYAEFLGQEMGLYRTPFEQVGRASYEMWRACRLVVDTGIHAKRWTRAQAIARNPRVCARYRIARKIREARTAAPGTRMCLWRAGARKRAGRPPPLGFPAVIRSSMRRYAH